MACTIVIDGAQGTGPTSIVVSGTVTDRCVDFDLYVMPANTTAATADIGDALGQTAFQIEGGVDPNAARPFAIAVENLVAQELNAACKAGIIMLWLRCSNDDQCQLLDGVPLTCCPDLELLEFHFGPCEPGPLAMRRPLLLSIGIDWLIPMDVATAAETIIVSLQPENDPDTFISRYAEATSDRSIYTSDDLRSFASNAPARVMLYAEQRYFGVIKIDDPVCGNLEQNFALEVPACICPDRLDVPLSVASQEGTAVEDPECIDAELVTVTATFPTDGPAENPQWEVTEGLLIETENGSLSVTVRILQNDQIGSVTVISGGAGCRERYTIFVKRCQPCASVPDDAQLAVELLDGTPVSDPNNTCIDANGVVVIAPDLPGGLNWNGEDGAAIIPGSETGRRISALLPPPGIRGTISTIVGEGDCQKPLSVSLERCGQPTCEPLPNGYDLVVRDGNGVLIRFPGLTCIDTPTATVEAPAHEGVVNWRIDNQPVDLPPDERTVTVPMPTAGQAHTVTAEVGIDDCAETFAVSVRRCPDSGASPLCPVLLMLIVMGLSVAVLGLTLMMCPVMALGHFIVVLNNPLVIMAIGGFMAAFGVGLGLISGSLWVIFCSPGVCEWLRLGWMVTSIAGITLIYYQACPLCGHLFLLGMLVITVAIGLLGFWLYRCRPSRCLLFNSFVLMLPAFDIVVLAELALGACMWVNLPAVLALSFAAVAFPIFAVMGQQSNNCTMN